MRNRTTRIPRMIGLKTSKRAYITSGLGLRKCSALDTDVIWQDLVSANDSKVLYSPPITVVYRTCTVLVLYCTVLYCTALYCTALYCTVLYWTELYRTELVLCCTVLQCTVLYCTAMYFTVLHCTLLYCTVLYRTELYCTELYRTVLNCTVLFIHNNVLRLQGAVITYRTNI